MIKIYSLILIVCAGLSLFACNREEKADVQQVDVMRVVSAAVSEDQEQLVSEYQRAVKDLLDLRLSPYTEDRVRDFSDRAVFQYFDEQRTSQLIVELPKRKHMRALSVSGDTRRFAKGVDVEDFGRVECDAPNAAVILRPASNTSSLVKGLIMLYQFVMAHHSCELISSMDYRAQMFAREEITKILNAYTKGGWGNEVMACTRHLQSLEEELYGNSVFCDTSILESLFSNLSETDLEIILRHFVIDVRLNLLYMTMPSSMAWLAGGNYMRSIEGKN